MASRSHAKCRNCGRARHLKVRSNLCGKCYQENQSRLKHDWLQIKARRRARAGAAPEPSEEIRELLSPPETQTNGHLSVAEAIDITPRVVRPLSDDQEIELVDLYTKHDVSAADLSERFGVEATYPYKVLERLGITWRQADAQTFDQWQEAQNPNLNKSDKELRADWRTRQSQRLSDELRGEILAHYSDPRVSTSMICKTYNLNAAVLLEIVRNQGVTMRNQDPERFTREALRQGKLVDREGHFVFVEASEPTVLRRERKLPPQIEAMRDVVVPSEPTVIVPAAVSEAIPVALSPEPVQETQGLVFASDDGPVWEITYTGKMLVRASNAREAIDRAEHDGHVTTIVGVNMRSSR